MSIVRWEDFQQPLSEDSVRLATTTLGELGRWWLTDQARRVACELDQTDYWMQRPVLPSRIGACWIMVVNPDQRTHALLRPAFLIPLIWNRGTQHSEQLPKSLLTVAQDVIQTLVRHGQIQDESWGLHLCQESDARVIADSGGHDGPDFRDLQESLFDFRSGWVALAGTVLSACRDIATNPAVWATGCWDSEAGVVEVGGLHQKLQLADEYFQAGQKAQRHDNFVVVPSANLIEANRLAAQSKSRFTAVAFPAAQLVPQIALSSYLALLRVQPPDDAPVESHVAYYKSILADDRERAEAYYQVVLYPQVVQQCRERMGFVDPMPTHLVTVVSPNNELVRLAVEVFGIKACILLYTVPGDQSAYTRQITDMSTLAKQAAEYCEQAGCTPHPKPFTYDASRPSFRQELSETIRSLVQEHIVGVAPEEVAFDMHSAHKIFNYVFDHAVSEPGNLMYWIDHLWFPAFRTQHPLTERFVVWRAGDDWSGHGLAGLEKE